MQAHEGFYDLLLGKFPTKSGNYIMLKWGVYHLITLMIMPIGNIKVVLYLQIEIFIQKKVFFFFSKHEDLTYLVICKMYFETIFL